MEPQLLADRYELRGILGEGGMARVYDGYDRVLARRVAIKLLREDLTGGRAVRERMLREARAAASFHHPNAVAVFDTGQENRTPFIIMELVEGGTLADEIARGALAPPRATSVALDVLSALSAAHQRGLVHRDVKPANIMLPEGEGAKLADFGIAKGVEEVGGLTAEGQVLGTPKYLSPEQVGGHAATVRSDVYAMGVVLYEMLAGEPPFTSDNPFAVAVAHQEKTPPRLDRRVRGLDRGLVEIVHRCLDKDPARRFSDAGELRAALQTGRAAAPPPGAAATTVALGGEAAAATVVAEPRPAPPPAPRGRGVGLAAVLVMLLVVAGLLAFQLLGDPASEEPTGVPTVEPTAEPTEGPAEEPPEDPAEAPIDEPPASPDQTQPVPTSDPADPTESPQPTPEEEESDPQPDPGTDPSPTAPPEASPEPLSDRTREGSGSDHQGA